MKHPICARFVQTGGVLMACALLGGGMLAIRNTRPEAPRKTAPITPVARLGNSVFDASGKKFDCPAPDSLTGLMIQEDLALALGKQALQAQGLRIYTTLDSELQKSAAVVVAQSSSKAENLNVSLLAVENGTDAVRAVIGGGRSLAASVAKMQCAVTQSSALAREAANRRPYLVARVCSETGELIYRAVSAEDDALASQSTSDGAAGELLKTLGWKAPVVGPGGTEEMREASFTASTSSLTCAVWVTPADQDTVLAKGHAESLAMPAWVEFMKAVPQQDYPAIAFATPVNAPAAEIPLVRRAVPVEHEPEVRRAIPVQPTIAFGGVPIATSEIILPPDAPVARALPVNHELAAQQAMVTRPLTSDDGPVSTGNGFVVFSRSVPRDAIAVRRAARD